MSSLRVALIVQGEGRGHMTQALALRRFLTDAGHEITRVLVGASAHREVPGYFVAGMGAPVVTFDAPTQVPDRQRRGVSLVATAWDVGRRMPRFVRAGRTIHQGTADADVVVNLLDLIGGASRLLLRNPVPAVAIAHNYLFAHPELAHAPGRPHARGVLKLHRGVAALKTQARVALSFAPMSAPPGLRLQVAPPLLRPGLDRLQPHNGGYLLSYALNSGYGDLLAEWHKSHRDVLVHCYVDGGADALTTGTAPGFHVHDLDQEAFLQHLSGCRAYVGSAGFESICEAFYLGKPVLAIPTEGQLEQSWNAWDAERCGTARAGTSGDLDAFWADPPTPSGNAVRDFRVWVGRAPEMLVGIIERVARAGAADRTGRG